MNFTEKLCEKCGFDKAVTVQALEFGKKLDISRLSTLFYKDIPDKTTQKGALLFMDAYYPYEFFDFAREEISRLGVLPEQGYLYIYLCLLENALCDFEKRGISQYVFFDTQKRLCEQSILHKKDKGVYGIYDYRFCANHVRGNILRLGEFEYQLGTCEKKEALFMHIPHGAKLTNRHDSYRQAREFFGNLPIILDSWLLYDEHKKMLCENSNIVSLMGDFEIVSRHETYDYSELFQVFGRVSDFSPHKLPHSTSLQRAYANRITKKLPVGSAVGVLKSK